MGVENNECIIATTWDKEAILAIREWVANLPKEEHALFAFLPSIVNSKQTLFMAPDGSKKGWETAERFSKLRDDLIELFESFNYEDGSNPFDYVEVGYGEFGQKVLRGNCKNMYGDEEYAT